MRRDLRRSWRIFQAMRREQSDPVATYTFMAHDVVGLLGEHRALAGASAIDVGGGPGYTAQALRSAGADAFTVEPDAAELRLHGRDPEAAVVGDGLALPFEDRALDVVCTLNALEHVVAPWEFLEELVRVVRPGGLVYVGVTNWLSPWGGHETSPWHYLGGERAARRYRKRMGQEAKNRFGSSLFPIRIGDVLRWAEANAQVRVVDAYPRYYPSWCRFLVRVPGVREVLTWNFALVLERR